MHRYGGRRPVGRTAVRVVASATALLASGGCGDDPAGSGEASLTPFERVVAEEIAVDRVSDLLWVADESHGGVFPQLGYAYGLPGVPSGALGSVTVDPTDDPGLFDPFCQASAVPEVRGCLRLRLRDGGDYEAQVYYTAAPHETPREEPELVYPGEDPAEEIRYGPQPLRIWEFELAPDGGDGGNMEVRMVSTRPEEAFKATSGEGVTLEVTVDGTMTAWLGELREVGAHLSVDGMASCPELRIDFEAVEHGPSDGSIRCGEEVRAELVFVPGEPLEVVWR